jgi:signal transduction histidine kinase
MPAADPRPAPPWRSLTARLAATVLVLSLLLTLLLVAWIVPRTEQAFVQHGDTLLADGRSTMRGLAEQQTIGMRTVLVDLIRHTAAARAQALADLPLESFGGDVAAIRSAIAAEDEQRARQQQENVQLLAREVMRRADRGIDQGLAALSARQAAATETFTADLRRLHLGFVVLAALVLLVVLGFGMHHFVVRPARRLRDAARAVAGGDLEVPLPTAGGDEIGELARDFGTMLVELRHSRAELQRLAAGLEVEVARKTAHLERALHDLRSTHQQLAAAERLAALGTLAGGIAHEFHNVIGGIRGCTGELLVDEPVADRRETLGVIQRAADRATGIVQQLLRFARRSVEQETAVDLVRVADDALRLCEPAARRQSVVVERYLAPGVVVRGDAGALHQVAVNLLTNALQAMPDGGSLRVTVAATATEATLAIADTGTGIAEADLPHLFEPFFTTKRDPRDHTRAGTGLGLSVSYGIVTAHRGRIDVQSALGAGTTFSVVLPRVAAGG